jgi:predicted ribosomally synthesized peptide with nif11-like leader
MSEEQLTALLAKLKDDDGLRQKLQGAADLDAAVAVAKEAGFDVSKTDWLKYHAKQTLELSDMELEVVAGARKDNKDSTDVDDQQWCGGDG